MMMTGDDAIAEGLQAVLAHLSDQTSALSTSHIRSLPASRSVHSREPSLETTSNGLSGFSSRACPEGRYPFVSCSYLLVDDR